MKKHFRYGLFFALGAMLALGFVACGDESSSGPSKNEESGIETEVSSSSENDEAISSSSDKDEVSSSSKKVESSSSTKAEVSSSSAKNKESSSSVKTEESSSSSKVESSSSKDDVSSSSQNVQSSSSDKPLESSSSKAKSSSSEISSSSVKPAESSSSESSSSVKLVESSSLEESSSSVIEASSSSLVTTGVCKTELEDHCTYDSLYDERDGQIYKTVKIGEQWWMAENLRFEDIEQSACYNNDPNNCQIYGRLYKRNGAIDNCPIGWHLPSQNDWYALRDFVLKNSGREHAGRELRADTLWNTTELGTGYDSFGFRALPGGAYDAHDGWWGISKHAVFWLSDDYKAGTIVTCYTFSRIRYNKDIGGTYSNGSDLAIGKSDGICEQYPASKYSVRCIKD